VSAAQRGFFAVAKVIATLAAVLGGIGAACGLAVIIGGQFQCTRRILGESYRTGDFIGLLLLSAFIAAMAR